MRLGIEHKIIETKHRLLTEDQIKILQRLREPERLHAIGFRRPALDVSVRVDVAVGHGDVVERGMRDLRARVVRDGAEHAPGGVAEGRVARDAVQDEDGFDGFGSIFWWPCGQLRSLVMVADDIQGRRVPYLRR